MAEELAPEWNNDNWSTPWRVVRALELEFGPFHLDPCADPDTAKAPKFYTAEQDGLRQKWEGRVFCNPPYSDKPAWIRKARASAEAGALVVMLLPARTDSAWFHDLVLGHAEVRFLRRRVVFEGGPGRTKRPLDGSLLAILGPAVADSRPNST